MGTLACKNCTDGKMRGGDPEGTGDYTGSAGQITITTLSQSVDEGTLVTFTVERTGGTVGLVGCHAETWGETATYLDDYLGGAWEASFPDGDATPWTVDVLVVDDPVNEPAETFRFDITDPTGGATLGVASVTITINASDAVTGPGVLSFTASTASVSESGGSLDVEVTRTGGADGQVSVDYATANGTATAGSDYTAKSGTLTFLDQDVTTQTINIPIVGDLDIEGNENLTLTLSSPTGGATLGTSVQTITIIDDDIGGAPSVSGVTGTVTDGNTLTISGTNFGAGPVFEVFDDFTGGTLDANLSTGPGSAKAGEWDARDATGSSYYGNQSSISGGQSLECDYSVHYSNWIERQFPAGTTDYFVSWWLYLPVGMNYPGEGGIGINWKQMWAQGADTGDDDTVIPTRHSTWQINGNDKACNPPNGYSLYPSVTFSKGTWARLSCWFKGASGTSAGDGEVKMWQLMPTGVALIANDQNASNLKTGGFVEKLRPNGYGRQTSNCVVNFDDIYIATGPNAQARVEIGNASTYTACTDLTILTPLTWGASITVDVNAGRFTSGAAFLFVINSAGTPSAGFPVTVV